MIKRTLSNLKMLDRKVPERAFVIGLLAIAVFKFWLVCHEEIYGSTTEYDCLWFLNSAKNWYWGMPYSWTAFCRPSAYPLFIALVHSLGIPLRIAIEFLQIGGYLVLIAALRRARCPRWICLSIFVLLVLHPASFQLNNYALADPFYAALLTYAAAGILFTLITARIKPAVCSGIAFAILWNTREESILLPVIFLTYVALAFCFHYSEARSWRDAGKKLVAPALSMFAAAAVLIIAASSANYCVFGAFAKSETRAPSLEAAYRALLRIKPSHPQRFIPVSREAREIAYTISPTFAQLKPHFEGKIGQDWEMETLSTHGIRDEIGAGWFLWALRAVADGAGIHRDPQTAARFYRQMAKEINLACDEKRIPSRIVLSTFVDPGTIASLRYLPQSLEGIVDLFIRQYQMSPDREDAVLRPAQRALYDEMTARRGALTRIGTLRIVGWAFDFGDPLQLVAYDSGGGEITSALTRFGPRPDVVESFRTRGDAPVNMEFGLPIEVRRGKIPAGNILFVTQTGRKFIGSTNAILSGEAPRENGAAEGATLMCRVFAQEFTPSSVNRSLPMEDLIGKYHPYLIKILTVAGLVAAIALAFCFRRLRLDDHFTALLVLLAVMITSRVALFTFIDAAYWAARDPRYLFPVMPLYSCFLILLIYQAVRVVRSSGANAHR